MLIFCSKYLGRKVWKDSIDSISKDENKWSAGYFVKPVRSKAFTGKIISNTKIGEVKETNTADNNFVIKCCS